jgi:V8-like Glu-specific endopeptidase
VTENFTTVNPIIARIYNQNDRIIGTGFLISPHRLLTCAHVVIQALGIEKITEIPQDPIKFDFPRYLPLTAKVVFWQPCSSSEIENAQYGEDIAVLEIIEPRSFAETVLNLLSIDTNEKQQINIFGFPEGYNNGVWTENKFRDLIFNGWLQMDQIKLSDRIIEGGFSGAPAWDKDKKTIIGMVTASDLGNQENKTATAFAIPSSVLIDTCLKFLELQDILLELDLKTVKKAYTECRQRDLEQLIPETITIQEIIRSFANEAKFKLPKEKVSLDLNSFILHLIINLQKTKPNEYNLAVKWGKKYIVDFDEIFNKKTEKSQKTLSLLENEESLSSLMLRFQEVQSSYIISAIFITKNSNIPLQINPEDKEKFTLEEVYQLLPSIIEDLLNQINQYQVSITQIIFFLPYSLLNEPLETITIQDEDELLIPLRVEYQLNFRSEKRLQKKYKHRSKWENNWIQIQACNEDSCGQHFRIYENCDNWQELFTELEECAVGFAVKKSYSQEIFKIFDRTGLPIAIWVKKVLQTSDYQQHFENLLECSIRELPKKIKQKHQDAFRQTEPDKHIGHHLTLLWEDPSLLPIDIDYSTP